MRRSIHDASNDDDDKYEAEAKLCNGAMMTMMYVFSPVPGGADGTLLHWDVSDGQLTEGRFTGPPITLHSMLPDRGHLVRL